MRKALEPDEAAKLEQHYLRAAQTFGALEFNEGARLCGLRANARLTAAASPACRP